MPVSVCPCWAVPVIVGGDVLTGAPVGTTTAVAADVALLEPAEFEAVTTRRIVLAVSAEVSVYVWFVAAEMLEQLAPDELQRRH